MLNLRSKIRPYGKLKPEDHGQDQRAVKTKNEKKEIKKYTLGVLIFDQKKLLGNENHYVMQGTVAGVEKIDLTKVLAYINSPTGANFLVATTPNEKGAYQMTYNQGQMGNMLPTRRASPRRDIDEFSTNTEPIQIN